MLELRSGNTLRARGINNVPLNAAADSARDAGASGGEGVQHIRAYVPSKRGAEGENDRA